tara:strand:+ start:136 stop:594 length:459 start_codon:yes stop_codon:yes gene_type:complete
MGRPIKKSKMVGGADDFGSDLAGKIAVTAFRTFGGSKVDSTVAYIVNQRGSRKFKVHLDDSTEEVMLLKAVAPASLAGDNVSGFGEFCVQVILDDSTVAFVEKFYNNTVHCVEADGTTHTVKYTLGAEGTDEGGGTGTGEKAAKNTGSIDVR